MASRWIRWHTTSHIWEYSIDNGSNWSVLPLNASILTEGTIDPARLPGGMITGSGDNVFTGSIPLSLESAAPTIQFKETDQAVDSRFWREKIDGASLKLQKLTDALAATDLITLNRSGQVSIIPSAAGNALALDGSIAGYVRALIKNTNAAVNSGAVLDFANDAGIISEIILTSTGHTPSSTFLVNHAGSGGIQINASHASGTVGLYTGGSGAARLLISASGSATFSGSISERSRSAPMGEWTSYTVTWGATGTAPNIGNGTLAGTHMKVGKTVFFKIFLLFGSTTTVTGSTSWTFTYPSSTGYGGLQGYAYLLDSSASQQAAMVMPIDPTKMSVRCHGLGAGVNAGGTVPWTWTNGDILTINGFYAED